MTADFGAQIRQLDTDDTNTYDIKTGEVPVIITSAHGVGQKKRVGWKSAEYFTRGITKYVSKKTSCYYLVKNRDTGVDPNKDNHDEFKSILLALIEKNHIKIAIDIHGAKKDWNFDVEIGTLDGQSIDGKTIDKLIACLNKNGIKKIALNDPFKGGDITKTVHEQAGIPCLQLEINQNFRNLRKINNLKKLCEALSEFVKTAF